MEWPWKKSPENRGTLTFLPDGRIVLGVPHGTTDEEIVYIRRQWEAGTYNKADTIVFPWPVDVVDKRR